MCAGLQIQDIDRIWWLSIVATLMSFTYSFIGLGECIAQAVSEYLLNPLVSEAMHSSSPWLPEPESVHCNMFVQPFDVES